MSSPFPKSISECVEGLERGSFSSVELTRACLDRIERAKELNAFISVCEREALDAAQQADLRRARGERGRLLGVPVAIKDAILTKGVRTTAASKILNNFVPPYDATVTAKLKAAGAVVVGKTNMDEFAMGSSNENSFFGPVKNPWDTACVPGGSSGGSAAAVAARLIPAALGTDTGGSIRQPASFCSVVGIKPTYGRVSRYGVIAYASSFDQVGPFAANVRDCARVTTAIAGKDPHDSTSAALEVPDFESGLGEQIKGLRVGIPREYFIEGLNKDVERSIREVIAKLAALGAEIVEISLPHTELALAVYYILAPAEASSNLSRYDGVRYGYRAAHTKDLKELYSRTRSEGFGKEVKRRILIGTHVLSTGYYDAYYLRAQKVRALIAQDFAEAFATQCDLIVCPTAPTAPFRIGEKVEDPLAMYLSDIFTIPVNLAGIPALTVPCGFDSKGGPVGVQLIGKPWDEATLFKVGYAYEQSTAWHQQLPQMVNKLAI